jgi:uncharacterized protein
MKPSKYNYYIPCGENTFIFNGVTNLFITVSSKNIEKIKEIILHPDILKLESPNIFEKLKKCGFIIEDNFDEIQFVLSKNLQYKQAKNYLLMILPTYDCNFSCWYCVQKHQDTKMNEQTINNTKKHIEKYLLNNDIKLLEIAWFGGEPLLEFDIVENISNFALYFCANHNIIFRNSMTTNGFLLTPEIIHKMVKLKFESFQITIDGIREQHNKTRHNPIHSSFDIILSNIVSLLKIIENVSVTLRFNYTNININIQLLLEQLNEIFPVALRKKIEFLPRKVWQIDEKKIDETKISELFKQIHDNGYTLVDADINGDFLPCYVDKIHMNTIFPNGCVDKCSNINLNECKGYLDNKGKIIWKEINNFDLNNACLNCQYLSVCMGGCPKHRELLNRQKKICCPFTEKEHIDKILRYCESVSLLNNNSINQNEKSNSCY